MALIKSDIIQLECIVESAFAFLHDLNNLQQLLPEEKLEKWSATKSDCTFCIQGLPSISLHRQASIEPSSITLVTIDKKPVELQMMFYLEKSESGQSILRAEIDASVNPFMMNMVKQPLTNFLNGLGEKLKEVLRDNPVS